MVIQIAVDNPGWGYEKITGVIENLDESIGKTTVQNILRRNGFPPSGIRQKNNSWNNFIKQHKDLWATDFFTVDLKPHLFTKLFIPYYLLFFIHINSRRIVLGGITHSPHEEWMKQIARNVTGFDGQLEKARYLIHDRDSKYTESCDYLFRSSGIKPIKLPPQSPNLNAYAERFVRSIKEECLNRCILFGEKSLRKAVKEYLEYYHYERNHQGKGNKILFPYKPSYDFSQTGKKISNNNKGRIVKKQRLGGLLNFYYRQDAA